MKRFMIMMGCLVLAIAFAMPASAVTVQMDDFEAVDGTAGWWMDLTLINAPQGVNFDRIQAISSSRPWPHGGAWENEPTFADGFQDPGFSVSGSANDGGEFAANWSEVARSGGVGASTVVARGSEISAGDSVINPVVPGEVLSFRLNFTDTPTQGVLQSLRLEFFDGSNTNHVGTYDRLWRWDTIPLGQFQGQFGPRVRQHDFLENGTSTVIPEPMTMTLLGMGLAGVAVRRFRAKK